MASRPPWERYAEPAQAQPIITRQADPRLPIQTQRERVGLQRDTNAAAASQYDAEIARANAARAQAEATTAQANASAGGLTAQQRNALTAQMVQLENASRQIDALENLYQQDFQGGRGSVFGLGGSRNPSGYLPNWLSERNQRFNNAANALMSPVASAEGLTAQQQNTPAELQIRFGPNIPSSSDTDQTIEDKIGRLRSIIDTQRQSLTAQLGPSASAAVVQPGEQMDRTNPLVMGDDPNAAPQLQLSNGREQMDPARLAILRQAQQRITSMLRSGASDSEIADYARQQGLDATSALRFRQTPQFRQWNSDPRTRNQVYPLDLSASNVPMGGVAGAVASAAASPIGTGVIQGGNAVIPAALLARATGGDPEQARLGIEATQQANPTSALLGNLAGSALAYSAGGGLAGRAGTALETAAPRVANFLRPTSAYTAFTPRAVAGDALYGAYQGAGENDDPLSGALEGTVGGMFGRGAVRTAGRALRGVQDRSVRYLSGHGVPLTLGEIAQAGNGVGGRIVSGIEDRLAGLPGIGDFINARRLEGRTGFNSAAFRRGTGVDATGSTGVRQSQRAASNAYDRALDGVNVTADTPFRNDWNAARAAAAAIPGDTGRDAIYALDQANSYFGPGGSLTGRDMQAARDYLRAARGQATGVTGQGVRDALTSGEGALTDLVNRQSPGTMGALTDADRLYRNSSILGDAVGIGGAKNQTDELFTPAQLATADVNSTIRFGGRNAARAGRTPFYALRRAGQEILGNRVPDSGTAGRMQTAFALGLLPAGGAGIGALTSSDDREGGAASGAQTALGVGALLALPYTRAGRNLIQRALVGRPRALRNAGNYILDSRPLRWVTDENGNRVLRPDDYSLRNPNFVRVGGMFGAPLVDYASGRSD